jgi:TRAP-type C4-dicarboxylate transport system substrate-binding protein
MINKTTLAIAAVLGGAVVASGARADTTLQLNHYMFVKHFFVQKVVKPWGEKVARLTQGRVKVAIPVAKLSPTPRQWSSVVTGVADLAISHDGFQRKRLQLMQVAYLPLTTFSAEKSAVALWRTYEKFFLPANEYKGVKLIGVWQHGGSYVFNAKNPIDDIGDFKGLKIRATAGMGVATFKALGASVVTSAGPQIFELVSKGIVDALAFPADGIKRFKVDKYLKHVTYVPGSFYNQSWSLIMNQQKWNALSAADKAAIDGVSGEQVGATAGHIFDSLAGKAWSGLIKGGMKRTDASPAFVAALKARLAPIEADYIKGAAKKGVDGKAALAYFHQQAK